MTYGTTHREDKRGEAQEFSFGGGSEMTPLVQTSLEDLDEPGARWRRDTRTIQKIVLLENELGRPLTMLDLLRRSDRRELDSVSDILHWLVVEGCPRNV
jgi:hypothetical protein